MARKYSDFDKHVVVYADTARIKLRVFCGMAGLCWMFFMNAGTQAPLSGWIAHFLASFFVLLSIGTAIDVWRDQRVVTGLDLANFRGQAWNEAGRSMFSHVVAHESPVRVAHIRLVAKAHVELTERRGGPIDWVTANCIGRDIHEHMNGY